MKTSAQIFEALGYAWNTPNYQHSAGPIVRQVEGPGGYRVELEWEIEGYGPDGEPKKAQAPVQVRTPRGCKSERSWLSVAMRNENVKPYRAPEYRRVIREGETCGRHPEAKDVILTAEMMEKRKRQQAAVKARLTRHANRAKAQEQARLAMVEALRVKLSQGAKR